MIADAHTWAQLQFAWVGVLLMRNRMQLLVISTFTGRATTAPALGWIVYNLPLLRAIDVLKQVLVAAREEGRFARESNNLSKLMEAAKGKLTWLDWDALREGVERRNKVAHEGELFDAVQCMQEIANVEAQLVAWGVISAPTAG